MNKIAYFSEKPINAYFLNLTETKNYKRFIDIALKYADTICMTYNGGYKDFKESEWSFLNSSLIGYEITKHTAVTKGPTVCLIYLKIDSTTRSWLKQKRHIYDFIYYDEWFDDLCLIKNKEVVFCSCTHEEFCYMNKDLAEILKSIP